MNYTNPEWLRSALIIIDTQNDFSLQGSPTEIPGTFAVIPNLVKLLNSYRQSGLPIIHVIRLYKTDGSNVDICRKELIEDGARIVTPNSMGSQIVSDLLPSTDLVLDSELLLSGEFQHLNNNEWVMYKPRWGAFYQTRLESFLLDKQINTLIFAGCNFPNCPRTSIYEASERDFRTILASDAVSGLYSKGIEELQNIHVHIMETETICSQLGVDKA